MAMRSGVAVSLWLFDVDPKVVPTWSSCIFVARAGSFDGALDAVVDVNKSHHLNIGH